MMHEIMKEYKIIFLRKTNGHAVGCVAIKLDGLNLEPSLLKQVPYQVSILSPEDKFDRKFARQLALGRLVEKPLYTSTITTSSIHYILEGVMKDITNNIALPKRARKAANYWIKTKVKEIAL